MFKAGVVKNGYTRDMLTNLCCTKKIENYDIFYFFKNNNKKIMMWYSTSSQNLKYNENLTIFLNI